jgi:hypothetical protein
MRVALDRTAAPAVGSRFGLNRRILDSRAEGCGKSVIVPRRIPSILSVLPACRVRQVSESPIQATSSLREETVP